MDSRSRDTAALGVTQSPDRIQTPGGVVCLPNLEDIVKQAKVFGWQIWRDVNPSVGQKLSVLCVHGHGAKVMAFGPDEMGLAAAVMGPTTLHLQGSNMHYTASPKIDQDNAQKAYIWRGQCYDCGNRHIGFSSVPEWVMGLNIIRYAVETDDINLTEWLGRSNSVWGRWTSEAPPAQLARQLTEWAREDIERYG